MTAFEKFEAALDRLAEEECDMRDLDRLRGLLKSYALMKGPDSQIGCLLYQASRVISRMTTELHAA